jgi:ABC-type oligopeptide transport system substrate-binding subunit
VLLTCTEPPCPQQAAIIKRNLAGIGITVDVHLLSKPLLYARLFAGSSNWDITFLGWGIDFADFTSVLPALLDGRTIGSADNADWSGFDNRTFESRLDHAATVTGPRRGRVLTLLADSVARRQSPMIAYREDVAHDLVARRVGCRVYQPLIGMDLARLCLVTS